MKIKPVTTELKPNYPDKYNDEVRRILTASKPMRWVGTPIAGVLSAAVALGLVGCSGEQTGIHGSELPGGKIHGETYTPKITQHIIAGDIPIPSHYMFQGTYIPLFEFGDGTGSIGCVAIVAPVFMTEEEAFEIISAAFAEAGLHINRHSGVLNNMNIPVTNTNGFGGSEVTGETIVKGTLQPDGLLTSHELPVEFVSNTDVSDWHRDDGGPFISVSLYDMKQAAQTLAENNPGIIVFYDPVGGSVNYEIAWRLEREEGENDESFNTRVNEMMMEQRRNASAESEQLLRQQVEAFIAWLFDMG